MKSPTDAIVAVTYRCNAHCLMCSVWKSEGVDRLAPEHLKKLPPSLRTVNLTGGEPFLRDDLPAMVQVVRDRCRRAQITISTNAYLPDRIERMMREIHRIDPTVRVAISLDGIGAAHDQIRGDEGAFENVMDLIGRLQASGTEGLRLGMTISGGNCDQLEGVAAQAETLGLELGVVAAHSAQTHLGVESTELPDASVDLETPFGHWIRRWLGSWNPKRWLRAHFLAGTCAYLRGRRLSYRCRGAKDFFFLQADGTIWSCSVLGKRMGNILTDDWNGIWTGPQAVEARRFVRQCREGCWMICNARSLYRARWLGVISWIVWKKLTRPFKKNANPTG